MIERAGRAMVGVMRYAFLVAAGLAFVLGCIALGLSSRGPAMPVPMPVPMSVPAPVLTASPAATAPAWRPGGEGPWLRVTPTATLPPAPTAELATVEAAAADDCPAAIVERFEDDALACRIAWCESRWNPLAHNLNPATGDDSVGLFQINLHGGLLVSRIALMQRLGYAVTSRAEAIEALTDPVINAAIAYEISGGGYSWAAWACR